MIGLGMKWMEMDEGGVKGKDVKGIGMKDVVLV